MSQNVLVAAAFDVATVGPLRVIQAFMPLLKKSIMTALIVNISSEAGSIGACYRTNMLDYAMAKAPLIPYDNAETMRILFEERRNIKDGDLFITYEGKAYPW